MSEELDVSEVFVDTSVLLNYVQQWLERERGSVAFFEEHHAEKVISETVEGEFSDRCDARSIIYHDMTEFVAEVESAGIEAYDIDDRDPLGDEDVGLMPSDRDNVLDVQVRLVMEDPVEALRKLREYLRLIDSNRRYVEEQLREIVGVNEDAELVGALASCVENSADRQVITDAAGWYLDDGSGTVTTLDHEDILSNRDAINETLKEHHTVECRLSIISTDVLLERSD